MNNHHEYIAAIFFAITLHLTPSILRGQNTVQHQVSKTAILFSAGAIQKDWPTRAQHETKRQPVKLSSSILLSEISTGQTLDIDLFDGQMITGKVSFVSVDVNHVLAASGKIERTQYGHFYLSYKNGVMLATIDLIEEDRIYLVTYESTTHQHFLTELNPRLKKQFECAPPLRKPQ